MTTRDRFDLIMSDADHLSAHLWHDHVFDCLLKPGGVTMHSDPQNSVKGEHLNHFRNLEWFKLPCRIISRGNFHFNLMRCAIKKLLLPYQFSGCIRDTFVGKSNPIIFELGDFNIEQYICDWLICFGIGDLNL